MICYEHASTFLKMGKLDIFLYIHIQIKKSKKVNETFVIHPSPFLRDGYIHKFLIAYNIYKCIFPPLLSS